MYTLSLAQILVLRSLVSLKAGYRRERLKQGYSLSMPGGLSQPKLTDSDIDGAIDVLVSLKLAKRNKANAVSAVYDYDKTLAIATEAYNTLAKGA